MSNDQLKQYYENSARRFWDPREGMKGRDLHIYPLLAGLSGSVLEYGCGAGSLLLQLAKEERFTHCTGVDISDRVLSNIKRNWSDIAPERQEKVSAIAPIRDRLPQIPDESVDVILSLDTIEHVIDPYVVIDELHRIARSNATFIISVPNLAYIKYVVNLMFGIQPRTGTNEPVENWRRIGWDGMHIHTFTKSSLRTLLMDCGWQAESWSGYGDRFSNFGMRILRERFPGVWSGAITAVCKKTRKSVSLS